MNMHINYRLPFLIWIVASLLSGCAGQEIRAKSSVVDYLYPSESTSIVKPSIPVLNIPIKVGIAFVPEQTTQSKRSGYWPKVKGGGALTEARKEGLLEKVASHFRQHKFVSDIEVIPSAYLNPGGSFANLKQIRTMYGIDVIALVSYDQVQFTEEGMLSLAYWTLVGVYVASGEKNDTSTMLDTVVYDIQSKKMLFRAPGTSNIKGAATPINLSEELRADSIKGFEEATTSMISNLDRQLAKFREKIKRNPERVKVVHRASYSGGGVIDLLGLTIMFLVIAGLKFKSNNGNS